MRESFQPLRHYGFGPLTRDTDASYRVQALPAQPTPACPQCGAADAVGFGRRSRDVADLPLRGRPVRLAVTTRRYRCVCGHAFYEVLPEIDPKRRMTLRLKRWIEDEVRTRGAREIAAETGLSEGTVRLVVKDAG